MDRDAFAQCVKCKFFEINTKMSGHCHKSPPVFVKGIVRWPDVVNEEWCGDFEQKCGYMVELDENDVSYVNAISAFEINITY